MPGSAPHKQHQAPTPLAGGIALTLSLAVLVVAWRLWENREAMVMLLAAAIIFGFGLRDDARGMTAPVKFFGQTLATLVLVAGGIQIRIFESPDFLWSGQGPLYAGLNYAITWLWVVGVTNAFNLVDSADGLTAGLSGWAFAFFMLATFDSRQGMVSFLSALLLGCCLALIFYNSAPARLFLGDSGAQTLGFLLASIAIVYNPLDAYQASSWFVPILLVGVPIFDTCLVFFSRLRRGKEFYKANRDHTFHRLVALGLEPSRAVLAMQLAAVLLECAAFIAVSLKPVAANGLFVGVLGAGLLLAVALDNRARWP